MKPLLKSMLAGLALANSAFAAEQTQVLVTATPVDGGTEIRFEILNDGDYAGVSYDLRMTGIPQNLIEKGACVGPQSLAGCAFLPNGDLRVGIIQDGLKPLETGLLGKIFVRGEIGADALSIHNVTLVGPDAHEVPIEPVADFTALKEDHRAEKPRLVLEK